MNFPGTNMLKLSQDALKAMVEAWVTSQLGVSVRITAMDFGYSSRGADVEFTTDPLPAEVPQAIDCEVT